MQFDDLVALVGERLGTTVQAMSPVDRRSASGRSPCIWEVLTEHGSFWALQEGLRVELFRASDVRGYAVPGSIRVTQAVRRFLELHPEPPKLRESA